MKPAENVTTECLNTALYRIKVTNKTQNSSSSVVIDKKYVSADHKYKKRKKKKRVIRIGTKIAIAPVHTIMYDDS